MSTYTNERTGFHTKEAAQAFQIKASATPAYSSLHPAFTRRDKDGTVVSADIFVTDPIHRAGGRVHTYSYRARSKGGEIRTYFGSYVGA